MHFEAISITSQTSAETYTESSVINLDKKWFDLKRLALHVEVGSGSVSGLLDIYPLVSYKSGTSYTTFVTGSGSSLLLTSGSSLGGESSNGAYFIPITIVPHSGVTKMLTAGMARHMKFGMRATDHGVSVAARLLIG